MTTPAAGNYRPLFYASLALAVALGGLLVVTIRQSRREEAESVALLHHRDVPYDFTVNAYGYTYAGRTGNLIDDCVLLYGAFEKDSLFFMRDWLRANAPEGRQTAVDVGANTGNHSLFLSRYCDKVLAVEPFPPVIARLRRNLELSPQVKNVEVLEVGFGDADAELPFLAPPAGNEGNGSFRVEAQQAADALDRKVVDKLRVVVGDAALEGKVDGKVGVVKIDVEGFEEGVLKGLARTLARDRPLLLIEVTPPPVGTIVSEAQLLKLLPPDYGLRHFRKLRRGWENGSYRVDPLDAGRFNNPEEQLEVVAFPREREARVPAGQR